MIILAGDSDIDTGEFGVTNAKPKLKLEISALSVYVVLVVRVYVVSVGLLLFFQHKLNFCLNVLYI